MVHHLTSVVPFSFDNTPRYRVKDEHNNDVCTSYIVYIEMHTQPLVQHYHDDRHQYYC